MNQETEPYRRGFADRVFEGLFWSSLLLLVAFIGVVAWKATA